MKLRIDGLELNNVEPSLLTVTARQHEGPFKSVTLYADIPSDPRCRTPFYIGEVVGWTEFWMRVAQWDGKPVNLPLVKPEYATTVERSL
jgi:hypothetical protein